MKRIIVSRLAVPAIVLGLAAFASHRIAAQSSGGNAATYLMPPPEIARMIDAPPIPSAIVSPSGKMMVLLSRRANPPIAELARPMLGLAGTRVNPKSNGPHRTTGTVALSFKAIDTGAETKVATPVDATFDVIGFSPDGSRLAFTATRENGISLWTADTSTGKTMEVAGMAINGVAAGGGGCEWFATGTTLLCTTIVANRGAAPAAPAVPSGPNVQEAGGVVAPVRTYEDMLTSAHDESLFDFYFATQLALVDAATGSHTNIGRPAIVGNMDPSPNGEYILVSRIKRPYSWLIGASAFPNDVEVWNRRGDLVKTLASVPLADVTPIGGVITGPRRFTWRVSQPATLVWVEALDRGDPKVKVPFRDRLLSLAAPFTGAPAEIGKTEFRFGGLAETDTGVALLTESDRTSRVTRTWILDGPGAAPRPLWYRKSQDAYKDPGNPVSKIRPARGLIQNGDWIYLSGNGASPQGDRPFLDRLNLKTLATERLFRTDDRSYETVIALLSADGRTLMTRRESRTDPPNYYVRDTGAGSTRAVTSFADPNPVLRTLDKQLVTYKRKDGVQLSGTLYLPPNRRAGERLPLIMWAYPVEFGDADAASQVTGSPHRFTTVGGPSHLYLLLHGYAVLDGASMPIVGPEDKANDTYVEQLVASAEAAIDKVVEMGVADRNRIGVGGHSYGAFMTANLLAHSRLFRAGFAESGAYNRSLTPFGFQNETRTFWDVPQLYAQMSPFWFANRIKDPILLMHGEMDDNPGTFPVQSERFYMALKGFGATVRYVTLPYEAHGYAARETLLHVVAEKINWFDKYVKNAGMRPTATGGQNP